MNKRPAFLFVTILAVLAVSFACAAGMDKVPAGRITNITLPAGLVLQGDPVIADGKVSVSIDDDATDWSVVLMKAAQRDNLSVDLQVTAPAGMVSGVRENFGAGDPETLEAISQGVAPEWFTDFGTEPLSEACQDGSAMFAELQFAQPTYKSIYVDLVPATGAGTLFCWENEAGEKLYEYLQWEISHSNAGLREVPMPALAKQLLSSVPASVPAGVSAKTEAGGIICTVDDFSALTALPVVISAPAGATEAVVYTSAGESTLSVENGKIDLNITASSHPALGGRFAPAQLDYTIAFVSGEEPETELHAFGLVSVWLLDAAKAPYPYYNTQNAVPVANARLTIRQGKHQLNNKVVYRENYGEAHLSKAELNFSASNSGSVTMEVTAPEWAVAYGMSESGSDFIYQTDRALVISPDKKSISGGTTVKVYDQLLFKTVQAGRAFVYLQQGITARYGGHVRVLSWYDDVNAETPRLIEYLAITHEDFAEKVRSAVKSSEQDITAPVSEVTGVSGEDWQLVIRYDPQEGDRAVHYDLHMEDTDENACSLDGKTVFYLPYPDGLSYADEDAEYQLLHFSTDYSSSTSVALERTPNGLRFVEDHLSPFVLMWDAKTAPAPVPAASLPKTGDETPAIALLAVLAASLGAIICLLKRKQIR